jgi:hypothetical protein
MLVVAGLPVRVVAHGSLDSEKEKTRVVVKVTDPGFPFDFDDYGKVLEPLPSHSERPDGAGQRDGLKNFF